MRPLSLFCLIICMIIILLDAPLIAGESALFGEYKLVDFRHASDVTGGPIDENTVNLLGAFASFGEVLLWPGEDACNGWTKEKIEEDIVNINDPMLSDTQTPPVEGANSAGDKRVNQSFKLHCEDGRVIALHKVDDRILVAPTISGTEYMIFERGLTGAQTKQLQHQLHDMKFFSGIPTEYWDQKSFAALSSYAEYRGAKYRFLRAVITENLLDGLDVIDIEQCCISEAQNVLKHYSEKKSVDTILDYRPALRERVSQLQAIDEDSFTHAVSSLVFLTLEAKVKSGRWIKGKVALGAKPREFQPSDQELIAAEYGDRMQRFVASKDTIDLINAWEGEALLPFPIEYHRFHYRHVDVMGSGRYFYASEPQPVRIGASSKSR